MIKIRVRGISKLKEELRQFYKGSEKGQLETIATKLVSELKEETPVNTGYARSRWTFKRGPSKCTIENDAPYIEDLNNGSSRQAPRLFVEKTILLNPNVKPNGTLVKYE